MDYMKLSVDKKTDYVLVRSIFCMKTKGPKNCYHRKFKLIGSYQKEANCIQT